MVNLEKAKDLHHFVFEPSQIRAVFKDDVYIEVIDSLAFKRLKSINFLGAIDYLLPVGAKRPFQRHTRYHHSLAVGSLAMRYCELRKIDGKNRQYCVVAALLHDIGHAPLSHSLEPAFKSLFDIDHHLSGERILRGDVEIGVGLSNTLSKFGLNNFRIMSIISGLDESIFNDLFRHAVNVDTIEAILRSSTYIYLADHVSASLLIEALVNRDDQSQEVLDSFWKLKDEVYARLIQSPRGFMADYICKRYMELNRKDFKENYYYGTESQLRKDHQKLFDILKQFSDHGFIPDYLMPREGMVNCVRRKFFIDPLIKITDVTSLDRRYRQAKEVVPFDVKKKDIFNGDESLETHPRSLDLF